MVRKHVEDEHGAVDCPYSERIVKVEVGLDEKLPDNFRDDFATMRTEVKQMHETLFKNGMTKRIRDLELAQAKMLGFAGGIGAVAGFVFGFIQKMLGGN